MSSVSKTGGAKAHAALALCRLWREAPQEEASQASVRTLTLTHVPRIVCAIPGLMGNLAQGVLVAE